MPTDSKTQTTIPFERLHRVRLLERLRLPKPPKSARTSASTATHVLRDLESMIGAKDGFRVGHEAMAERLRLSVSAIKRACRYLRELGVLEPLRTGRASWYTIDWDIVAMLVTMADEQEHHASTQSKPAATRDRATARDVVRVQADAPSPAAVPVGNGLGRVASVQKPSTRAPSDRALCPIRSRTVPHLIAHCAPSTIPTDLPTNLTALAYSSSGVADGGTAPPSHATPSVTWEAVAEALRDIRLNERPRAVQLAQQRELTPQETLAIVDEWKANRSRMPSPGAILYRLKNDGWPAEGITTPRAVAEAERARAARRAELAATAKRHETDRHAWLEECHALESRYGAELDALDASDVGELARAAIERSPGSFLFDFWRSDWHKRASSTRYALLCEIHHNRHFPPTPRTPK